MSIIKRNEMFPGLNLFDDFFSRDVWNWGLNNNSSTNTTIPMVNVKETNENFEVEMAAPGMNKEDFKVELDGNLLTITRKKPGERIERWRTIFKTRVQLPVVPTFFPAAKRSS